MPYQRDNPRLIVLGIPGGKRLDAIAAAATRTNFTLIVVPWLDWIKQETRLSDVISDGDVVRIESPGRDFEVERAILLNGADCEDPLHFDRATRSRLKSLQFEKGRILWPRQWYLGFRQLLERLREELAGCAPHFCMNNAQEIALMFDKPACHASLLNFVPQPKSLGTVESYDQLVDAIRRTKISRVFVKLAHGSSGSGIVAYQTSGRMHRATTTVDVVKTGGEIVLYNTRKLRVLTAHAEIAQLIDALCLHRAHVEQWVPKAGLHGKTFDLRVVVIGGEVCHTVARLSASPVTNLHLLNARSDSQLVRSRMGSHAWARAMDSCRMVMTRLNRSLFAGIDLLIANDFRSHAVIEVNAFGDQLPGVLYEGRETYDVELSRCGLNDLAQVV